MNMSIASTILRGFLSRPAVLLYGVLGGAVLSLEIANHIRQIEPTTVARVAKPSRGSERWPEVVLPDCPKVVALRPPPKAARKLEQDFGLTLTQETASPAPLGSPISTEASPSPAPGSFRPLAGSSKAREVLAVRELGKLPYGGEALVTLPPDGVVEVTVKPSGRPFLEFPATYGVGGLYGVTKDGRSWRGYVFAEPVRVGRFHVRGEAGFLDGGDWYALAGAEVHF